MSCLVAEMSHCRAGAEFAWYLSSSLQHIAGRHPGTLHKRLKAAEGNILFFIFATSERWQTPTAKARRLPTSGPLRMTRSTATSLHAGRESGGILEAKISSLSQSAMMDPARAKGTSIPTLLRRRTGVSSATPGPPISTPQLRSTKVHIGLTRRQHGLKRRNYPLCVE